MKIPYGQNDLLGKRFIFFADDGGGGPSENFNPKEGGEGGGTAVSEQAAEQAAEEIRQTAAAAKQQRREEKKVKKRDYKLAEIIEGFINGAARDDRLAILLARLLQRNTPTNVILAVLSLNYPQVDEVLENYLDQEREILPDMSAEELQAEENNRALVEYGKEMALSLSSWTRKIFTHASFHPMKTIISLAHHHGVDHHMIQFSTFMIQEFFKSSGQEVEFDRMRDFSNLFWRDALRRLHHLADERGLLPEPSRDPMAEKGDEEEDDE